MSMNCITRIKKKSSVVVESFLRFKYIQAAMSNPKAFAFDSVCALLASAHPNFAIVVKSENHSDYRIVSPYLKTLLVEDENGDA
jgi:hypothetical protein